MGFFQERIGTGIRVLRERRRLSQSAVARVRGKDDQSRMSKVERGKQLPSVELLDSYLEVLDADPYELVDAMLDEEPDPEEIAEHVLAAFRLGDLTDAQREYVLEQIRSHREFLLKAVAQSPSSPLPSPKQS